jgi:hypothetical protein
MMIVRKKIAQIHTHMAYSSGKGKEGRGSCISSVLGYIKDPGLCEMIQVIIPY